MRSVLPVSFVLLVSALLAAPAAAQTTWNVPGDSATIQGAIVLASGGDTVLVQPGTYPETLDFLGKSLGVIGVGGAAVTIVDATGLGSSVVTFALAEDPATLLQGFTLTGGSGQTIPGTGQAGGGGIFLDFDADPVVRECVITANVDDLDQGAGVYATWGLFGTPGRGTLIDCEITDNVASGSGGGAAGGGASGLTLQDCLVQGNSSGFTGGGLAGSLTAIDCRIVGNDSGSGGGAANVDVLTGCTFELNTAAIGGGYYAEGSFGAGISDGTFLDNSATLVGGGVAIDTFIDNFFGPINTATSCVFAGNAAPTGNGLYSSAADLDNGGSTRVTGCTFDGDDVYVAAGSLFVKDTIMRNAVDPLTPSGNVTYSNVEGLLGGTGNIDADPLWVDAAGDAYGLLPGSPCINTGDPTSPLDPDGSRADMGAIAFHPWTDIGNSLAGAFGPPSLTGDGPLLEGEDATITLANTLLNATTANLVLGASQICVPFKGGKLVVAPDFIIFGLPTDGAGVLPLTFPWPALPSGVALYFQYWMQDPAGIFGFSASNGLCATTP